MHFELRASYFQEFDAASEYDRATLRPEGRGEVLKTETYLCLCMTKDMIERKGNYVTIEASDRIQRRGGL